MIERVKEIIDYREMIFSLARRELRGKYQKSVLGFLWSFISPLCQILIYTFVFTYIFDSGIDKYYIHLMVALIPWTFFSDSLIQGASCVVVNGDMTKKIFFPREVLPLASVTAKLVDLCLSMVIVLAFVLFSGIGFSPCILLLLLVFIIEYIIAVGFSLFFSAVTVYVRDMSYIVNVLMMAWVWATPVMYSIDQIPVPLRNIMLLNPMYSVVTACRDILYYKTIPNLWSVLIPLAEGIIILLIGEAVFAKLETNFAEEL